MTKIKIRKISKSKMYDFQVDQIKENKFEGSLYLKFEESAILISKVYQKIFSFQLKLFN